MALTLRTNRQADLIVSSLRKVFQTYDIAYLTKSAYNFLYLSSGFIAHYNLYGFQAEYTDVNKLKRELAHNYGANQWRNFGPKDPDYSYYMEKRDIYNRIAGLLEAEGYELNQGFW